MRLRFDWGILVSGKDGNKVLRRVYWSNKATSIVADAGPDEDIIDFIDDLEEDLK